jgi:hypothetical protein
MVRLYGRLSRFSVCTTRVVVIVGLAAAVLGGCSAAPAPSAAGPAAPAVPPPDDACLSPHDLTPGVTPGEPMTAPAYSSMLSPNPVPMSTFLRTSGDTVTGHQAILDFSIPGESAAAAEAPSPETVVLLSFTVTTTDPGGWQMSRSLSVVAFEHDQLGTLSQRRCPDHTLVAAMCATGHTPLPEHVAPGQTASGWVAFTVPRASTDLTLSVRHLDPDGGYANADSPLLHRTAG